MFTVIVGAVLVCAAVYVAANIRDVADGIHGWYENLAKWNRGPVF